MKVLAEHRHSDRSFSLNEAKIKLLAQRDQAFLKTSYGQYNFSCLCHPQGIGMHIKHRDNDSTELYWIADNPKSVEHDPLCLFFSNKTSSQAMGADKWALPTNVKVMKETEAGAKSSSSAGSGKVSRHRLIKRILYRALSESLSLYNFGQQHDLNYLFFKVRESNFASEFMIENRPLSKVLFAGKKGLVYLRQGFDSGRHKAAVLLMVCEDVSAKGSWLTVDGGDHYPCRQGALQSFESGKGPFLLAMLWGGSERPIVLQAMSLPIVHANLALPVHPNGVTKSQLYDAFKRVKANRNNINKLYLRVNPLSDCGTFEAGTYEISDGSRVFTKIEREAAKKTA